MENSSEHFNEIIVIEDSLHKYRTEIPNIIFMMNLDPFEFKAYCVFKMTAGDKGTCFKSKNTLCEEIGCGKTKYIEIKKALEKRGLIKISKRNNPKGGTATDMITIVDIWGTNMKIMAEKYPSKGEDKLLKEGFAKRKGGNRQTEGGESPNGPKQEHIEQDLKEEQQQQPAAASFKSSEKEQQKPRIYGNLKNIEIPESDKIEITRKYSELIVWNAITWATHPGTKVNKGLVQAIKWACINQPEIPKEKKDIEKENRLYAKKFDGLKNNITEVSALQSKIEFTFPTSQKNPIVLPYEENGFKEQLTNLLRKFNLK